MAALIDFFGMFLIYGGGPWFYIMAAVMFGLFVLFTEQENNLGNTIALVVYGFFFFQWNEELVINWTYVSWGLLAYIIGGGIYAFGKWIHFGYIRSKRYGELKLKYAEKMKLPNVGKSTNMKRLLSDAEYDLFKSFLSDNGLIHWSSDPIIPRAKNNIGRIGTWAAWWPFSLFWLVASDIVGNATRAFVLAFGGVFDRISQKFYSKFGVNIEDDE